MGRPKPFLTVGGRELLARALDAAAGACPTVLLVVDTPPPFEEALCRYGWRREPHRSGPARYRHLRTSLRLLADRRPDHGPLAGLETAWREGPGDVARWWALAADLPFVSPDLGLELLTALLRWEHEVGDETSVGTSRPEPAPRAVVAAAGGRPQPLCAAYGPGVPPLAVEQLERGGRSMTALLERMEVRTVGLRRTEAWRLLNVNTESDLRRARSRVAKADDEDADAAP